MSNDHELGLETLLAVRTELGVDLDDGFIEKCFDIQKKYQFNHERMLSTKAMDKLIEDYVKKTSNTLNEKGNR